MRIAFCILTGLMLWFIALVYPFLLLLRGKRVLPTVCICWGGSFLYLVALCLGLPLLVGTFDRQFAHEFSMNWVPDGKGVGAMLVIGWWPPLLAAIIAIAVKSLLKTWRMKRAERSGE